MTAVIGILNKNGMTMAADSAVTVTGGNSKKIYNTANKIFTLSKHHPIGIMIYSSSSFMTTPWEIIIKLYRKELKDTSFDTVLEYKNNFIQFLEKNDYFTNAETQLKNFKNFGYWNLSNLKDRVVEKLSDGKTEDELAEEFKELALEDINLTLSIYKDDDEILPTFDGYSLDDFKNYATESINEIIEIVFEGIALSDEILENIKILYWKYFKSFNFIGQETGLVFGGFGDKEIYPSILSIRISEVLDNRLRIKDDLGGQISDNNNGAILPFAQTDVINMFIKGIDPEIENTYFSVVEKFIRKYNKTLFDIIQPENPDLAQQVENVNIDEILTEFAEELNTLKREKQIIPTVDTVSILSKEDLAEMAESLIYLTYLKRRISSSEESVGGPIDVAIISKGDGFIWKKRKHYFSEELNKQFMANYFK
ncbi:hypothetical protein [Flavobacterium oreochromis]|uniref:Uncharacterized protein n=1 Tax=Flavobacterium columnare TaxID=996 RepID=A0A246G8K5_9FLAO|nr:hypothetical protein [Flavobacterium oreochromis]OWP75311.1 hypothetical protein BWK62_12280 [Flavobacterium oreochromis]